VTEIDVASLVMADIAERRLKGKLKYGTFLYPFNGRNAIQDAYEEALDKAIYLKQWLLEQERMP
jgi:hypothetical protein